MRFIKRLRPSPATVIASIALLVALSGTSYAAFALAPHSVHNLQLATGAVNSRVILDHGVKAVDLAPGVAVSGPAGPAGPAGPTGPAGPAGPAGPGAMWALVKADGTIIAKSGNISLTSHPSPGVYILDFNTALTDKLILSNAGGPAGFTVRGPVVAALCGGPPQGTSCPSGNDTSHVIVATQSPGDAGAADFAFYVAVVG